MGAEDATDVALPPSAALRLQQDGIRGRNKKAGDLEAGAADSGALLGGDSDGESDDESQSVVAAKPAASLRAVLNWWATLRLHFGDALLLQIFFVYFTQGVRSTLCSLGTSYYLNETLKLLPAQSEALRATAAMPWIIKPIYGMLSDSVPIWGTRRKSYLLIFSSISALAYLSLSLPGFISEYHGALVALVVASLGIAFCDVVIDGKVVEAARSERDDMAGNLQTLSWLSLSVGSVLGSMVSGYALTTFGPRGVFLLSAIGPFCVVLISLRIKEEPYHGNASRHGVSGFVQTVTEQCRALAGVVVDPICWRPMLWIFLSNALPPSLGEAMFSFKTNELHFSKSFLGFISTVGSVTLLGTTAMYNAYFRDLPFRSMFFRIQLASAAVSLAEVVLVTRLNVSFGVGDRYFIFGDEILSDVVARLKHMPSLVLCAKICPPGIEGTMFALLMSIYNFSWSVASYGGSWLCSYLDISKSNFAGLGAAVTIRTAAKMLPLLLLFMVPATTSIRSASASGRKTIDGGKDKAAREETKPDVDM
jgi:folate/biopterin transporter